MQCFRTSVIIISILASRSALCQESDLAKINRFAEHYGQAFETGDADQVVGLITDLTPDAPPLQGLRRIHKRIAADFRSMDVSSLEFKHDEVVVAGDWAYARGRSSAVVSMENTPVTLRGKYLWILRRQKDGAWKLARDSSSGNGKCTAPALGDGESRTTDN